MSIASLDATGSGRWRMMTLMSSAMSHRSTPRTRTAARILRDTRKRAGLTQRALAERAGVSQETIARIETSATQPRFDTLARLLDACGYELEVMPRLGMGVDQTLIASMLDLTSTERLAHGEEAARGMAWLRSAERRGAARTR